MFLERIVLHGFGSPINRVRVRSWRETAIGPNGCGRAMCSMRCSGCWAAVGAALRAVGDGFSGPGTQPVNFAEFSSRLTIGCGAITDQSEVVVADCFIKWRRQYQQRQPVPPARHS